MVAEHDLSMDRCSTKRRILFCEWSLVNFIITHVSIFKHRKYCKMTHNRSSLVDDAKKKHKIINITVPEVFGVGNHYSSPASRPLAGLLALRFSAFWIVCLGTGRAFITAGGDHFPRRLGLVTDPVTCRREGKWASPSGLLAKAPFLAAVL